MKKLVLFLFVASSVSTLLSGFLELKWLQYTSKPMIMISLVAYYLVSANSSRSMLVVVAMVFSLAGDVFLLDKSFFIPGLIAFLFAHLAYIFAYRQHRSEDSNHSLAGVHIVRLIFPVILAGTGLVIILYPSLNELKIPVIIYASVIALMVITALFRYGRTSSTSFWMVFLGAVLFMISDSILAINKFLSPVALASFWIMLTYTSAQFLIMKGLLKHWD